MSPRRPAPAAALLRAVNVGGTKLAMADLRTALAEAGLGPVSTYVQSGNVLLTSSLAPADLAARIHDVIAARFALDTAVFVRTLAELESILATNPLAGRTENPAHLHVTFLAGAPAADRLAVPRPSGCTDELVVIGREVYLYCPGGYRQTKLTNAYLERHLGVAATTRNWRTTRTLADRLRG